LYRLIVRHWMNNRVKKMRIGHVPTIPGGEANLVPVQSNFQTREAI